MAAREGKTEEKIKTDITSPELYKYFKEKNFPISSIYQIEYGEYNKIVKKIFEDIMESIIYHNHEIILPANMGSISIRGHKRRVIYKNGKIIDNFPIDWDATLKLWERDNEAAEKKIVVKNFNVNTGGYTYKFYWKKNRAKFKTKSKWKFRPTRTNKLRLAAALRNKKLDINFYNLY